MVDPALPELVAAIFIHAVDAHEARSRINLEAAG
jgi:hypothetical protein